MASMWRRAMVYLGLQDDDELDYGGEYESYGDYGEAAEEPQKGGCAPAAVPALVDALRADGLEVAGLMTVPPHGDDPRRWFAGLREQAVALELTELSMGMTDDFELAVEEGATMVRVGRALFGARPVWGT